MCLFGFGMTPLIIQRPPEPDERLNPPRLNLQGGDKGVHFVPGTDGHGLRTNRVGADEPVGPVRSVEPMGMRMPAERPI